MFSHIFRRNTDVLEMNEGTLLNHRCRECKIAPLRLSRVRTRKEHYRKVLIVWEAHSQNIKGLSAKTCAKLCTSDGSNEPGGSFASISRDSGNAEKGGNPKHLQSQRKIQEMVL